MSIVAYTDETISNAAYEALRSRGVDAPASLIPRLRTLIPTALEQLGGRVKESADFEKLQKDFSATPVAGMIDLSALTGILFDINRATVRVASTNSRLYPVDDILTLEYGDLPVDAVYYALDGRTLRIRSITGSLVDYVTPVKVRSSYVPSLTDAARPLPDYFEGALVETVLSLGMAGVAT